MVYVECAKPTPALEVVVTSPVVLRARIETLYMAQTKNPTPFGAVAWFAREVGMAPRTVWTWCSGSRTPMQPVLMVLTYMERDAGRKKLEDAMEARQAYHAEQLEEANGVG
jgi:hypothetical protein